MTQLDLPGDGDRYAAFPAARGANGAGARHLRIRPLTRERIDAAVRLHEDHLPQWRGADAALKAVKAAFGADFSYAPNLVRVATVNTLYGTNLKATHRMARHLAGILPRAAELLDPAQLVEALATLPPLAGEAPRRHRSFASKFCHFFVNADRYPIFDTAARDAIRLHLGPGAARQAETGYAGFCGALAQLKATYDLAVPVRDLDRYLWIAGMYLVFARGRRDINRDLLTLFELRPRPADLACIAEGLD